MYNLYLHRYIYYIYIIYICMDIYKHTHSVKKFLFPFYKQTAQYRYPLFLSFFGTLAFNDTLLF